MWHIFENEKIFVLAQSAALLSSHLRITVSPMNVATAIPSSQPLASGNANDYIAPAIPADAPLPPNALLEAGREYTTTRKHLRPMGNGVTHGELAQSKRRKADVEAASGDGTLHALITANHAAMMANHAAMMARFDRQDALIAQNSNYPTVGIFVSKFPMPSLLLTFAMSWFTHSGS
jgi:hypothetical protein